jgi:hypothetical protein
MSYAIIRAARIFCKQTWFLRRQYGFICTIGQAQYQIPSPPNEQWIAIKHGNLTLWNPAANPPNGSVLPLNFAYPTFLNPNINSQGNTCTPKTIVVIPYTQVNLQPAPDQLYPILLELITQPILGTQYLPDELGVEYTEALGYGALSWLLMQPGNAWTDKQGAAEYQELFRREMVSARIKAAYDWTPNNKWWANPGFASGQGRGWI